MTENRRSSTWACTYQRCLMRVQAATKQHKNQKTRMKCAIWQGCTHPSLEQFVPRKSVEIVRNQTSTTSQRCALTHFESSDSSLKERTISQLGHRLKFRSAISVTRIVADIWIIVLRTYFRLWESFSKNLSTDYCSSIPTFQTILTRDSEYLWDSE